MTSTILNYLIDPTVDCQIVRIIDVGSDEKGYFFISDITPAYPQGGGQESDYGIIDVGEKIEFHEVRFVDGIVKHYVKKRHQLLKIGSVATITIDQNRRKNNSILHTAGHLIASIAYNIIPGSMPTKGHHFNDGSYIELAGDINNPDEIKMLVQTIVNNEIKTGKNVSYEMVTFDVLNERCPFVQPNIPTNKELRIVDIEGYFSMACGGTHVNKLNEIPYLNINKVKCSKGVIRLSYNCQFYN